MFTMYTYAFSTLWTEKSQKLFFFVQIQAVDDQLPCVCSESLSLAGCDPCAVIQTTWFQLYTISKSVVSVPPSSDLLCLESSDLERYLFKPHCFICYAVRLRKCKVYLIYLHYTLYWFQIQIFVFWRHQQMNQQMPVNTRCNSSNVLYFQQIILSRHDVADIMHVSEFIARFT